MSLKLSEAAATSTRTWPGPGAGRSTSWTASTSAGGPFLVTCNARILAIRIPLIDAGRRPRRRPSWGA